MGANVNVAQAYLADITPPERRARAMGLIGAAFGLGFVIGPALGGISSRWGDRAPGLLAATLTGLNLLVAWFRLPETRVHRPSSVVAVPPHWRRFLAPFAVVGLSTAAFTVLYVVFPLYVERDLHYNRHHTAYFFVLIGLVTAAVQGGLVGRISARFGEIRLMAAGSVFLALGFAVLPLSSDPGLASRLQLPVLIAALLCLALGPGLVGPSASAYVSRVASEEDQGRALGTLQSVGAVARIVGPIIAGMVSQQQSTRAAFLVSAALAGAAGLASALGQRP
jgi:MFS family permease